MGVICGKTKIQCLGWIRGAIATKCTKQWFGRELVAAWHCVVLRVKIDWYLRGIWVYKCSTEVDSFSSEAGATWRHCAEQWVVEGMLWGRKFVAKVVVPVGSKGWAHSELCHGGVNWHLICTVSWACGFDIGFEDFCGEKKETSKIEFELWVDRRL